VTHSILVRPQLLGRPLVVLRKVRRWTKHTQHPDSGPDGHDVCSDAARRWPGNHGRRYPTCWRTH